MAKTSPPSVKLTPPANRSPPLVMPAAPTATFSLTTIIAFSKRTFVPRRSSVCTMRTARTMLAASYLARCDTFCLKVPPGDGYSIFFSIFCNMIKFTIQPGDGLPVLPQLCCHTFNCSRDLPKDRSLHQCS